MKHFSTNQEFDIMNYIVDIVIKNNPDIITDDLRNDDLIDYLLDNNYIDYSDIVQGVQNFINENKNRKI